MDKRTLDDAIQDLGREMYYHRIAETSTAKYVLAQENINYCFPGQITTKELHQRVTMVQCEYALKDGKVTE